MIRKRIAAAVVVAAALIGSATAITTATSPTAQAAASVPVFDHIVLVMFENHAYSQINGSSSAPYFNIAGRPGREVHPVVRRHPPQRAQLPRAVLRARPRASPTTAARTPTAATTSAQQLITAGRTFKGYSETHALRRLHRLLERHSTSASTTAGSTSPPCPPPATSRSRSLPDSANYASLPDRLLRHPEHVQRHARLLGRHG